MKTPIFIEKVRDKRTSVTIGATGLPGFAPGTAFINSTAVAMTTTPPFPYKQADVLSREADTPNELQAPKCGHSYHTMAGATAKRLAV